jgi:hypothetical protein
VKVKLEQHTNIKFCQRLANLLLKTLEMMHQVYREDSPSHTVVSKWHCRFKEGKESLGDDDHAKRCVTACMPKKIEAARQFMHQNHCVTVDKLVEALNISNGSCHGILSKDLNTCWVTQQTVPRTLTDNQCNEG